MQYLYLIECQNLFKIGVANDVRTRLAQLAIGNPFELTVISCFRFENAEVVERAMHQKFYKEKWRGEWFNLGKEALLDFSHLCELLGGIQTSVRDATPDHNDLEDAEAIQESQNEGAHWDFSLMFAEGWRMETNNLGKQWRWRRGSGDNREVIAGGKVSDLPGTVEEVRRVYDKEKYK